MERTWELRRQTFDDLLAERDLLSLPVVFTGNRQECIDYAFSNGYTWHHSRFQLFGGFWHRPADQGNDELIPT